MLTSDRVLSASARARHASAAVTAAVAAVALASACEPRPAPPASPPPAWQGPPGAGPPPPQYGPPGPAAAGDYDEYEEDGEYGEPWPGEPERVAEAPEPAWEPEPEPRRPPARAPRRQPDPPDRVAEPAPARTPPARPDKPEKAKPDKPRDAPKDKPKADEPGGPLAGILAAHNSARARHCAPPLLWSDEVAATAQKWAAKLRDSGCAFDHNPRTKYGENLAFFAPSGGVGPGGVTRTWYDEHEQYDYDSGRFSFETGHFTQLVWRDTTQLGCAVVQCRGGDIWVCNYHPAGNIQGLFKKNVLPPSCRKR